MSDHPLSFHHLSFEPLFSKLSCTMHPGEIIHIRGPNGSGKSTLLRILAGLKEPQEGKVICHEENIIYLGHSNGIKQNLTVSENLSLHSILKGRAAASETLQIILKKWGLASISHQLTQYLSAGQLRRLSLARLMLSPCKIWLLDEPHTALDSEGQALFDTFLKEHIANQGIAVIATHQSMPLDPAIKTLFLGDYHAA